MKTTPSPGDYAGAVIGYYVDGAFDFAFEAAFGSIGAHIWRRFPDLAKKVLGIDGDPADAAQRKMQQYVDRVLDGMGLS